MRVLSITTGIVLASLPISLAQSTQTTSTSSSSTKSISLSPLDLAASASSSLASSLSSRFGSFHTTLLFAPSLPDYNYDAGYISPIGSNGPNSETTTYHAYKLGAFDSHPDATTEKEPTAWLTFTLGPRTFLASHSDDEYLLPITSPSLSTLTIPPADVTTLCSYTTTAAKSPIPESVFASMGNGVTTLLPDNWPTYAAVCTEKGSYISQFSKVVSYSGDAWRQVTVLGEEAPRGTDAGSVTSTAVEGGTATETSTAGAGQITAWVQGVVVVAAAAGMAV